MLRKSLVSLFVAGCLSPILVHAEIIDALLNVNDILGSLCGQRMVVLWVDETEQIAPCVMAYSAGCVEAQSDVAHSCVQQLQSLQIDSSQLHPSNALSAK
ncbi:MULTISPECIES: hypothetical protein [Deefgea]|uniref:Uncharacterized protein n=1 Tax=Deefgea chitinilytica TaxID=570276 RepID=A0ABS2C9R9_9NEIS|nr:MULTISPECIES: hypothetical protein [Deefgea]MBM5570787.1 hypothetical protein [Deefgea chitinilytica]MBM9888016.1 hypothetical protein [Deefgea sp. CFH1-16]